MFERYFFIALYNNYDDQKYNLLLILLKTEAIKQKSTMTLDHIMQK